MQFNSYIFILCFLPLTLIGYFGLNSLGRDRLAKLYLLIMSLWFYGYFNVSYLFIICGSIVANFAISRLMESTLVTGGKSGEEIAGARRLLMIAGVIFNVAVIFYFKYYNFFVQNLNVAFGTDFVLKNIVLPLGISFFTFQQISFIVDAYRGEVKDYSFLEYALFVTFFPQLVAGPIVLHSELIPQFKDSSKWRINFENLAKGIMLFVRGLSKKVLIADVFGNAVNWAISQAAAIPAGEGALTVPEIIILMLSYTFQIYFDFSGYSDMAIGLGLMLNFDIPMNFNSPYKALSVADFWKRWHMTLTRFLTRYVYIPLGGSRKGKARTYLNTMIVFLVSGIWHGANWTFILWGILHGLAQCFNKITHGLYEKLVEGAKKAPAGTLLSGMIKGVSWAVTFVFINIAWLLFRADSVTMWIQLLKRFPVYYYVVRDEILEPFRIPKLTAAMEIIGIANSTSMALWISLVSYMLLGFGICLFTANNYQAKYKRNAFSVITTWILFILCLISLSSVSTFLYFNF
ncbi:MAG: MBOAT family protein [Butyrivibrio sp.]|nr:MBOAT family protein [Butyrivibrio sp.]